MKMRMEGRGNFRKLMGMKRIIELSGEEAFQYFLKTESYCNFDLPQYFNFTKLLQEVSTQLKDKPLNSFYKQTGKSKNSKDSPRNYDDVNYKFLTNKDGKYAWRPFQLIHPAIYVSLAKEITKKENWQLLITKFEEFQQSEKIKCFSLPLIGNANQSYKATAVSNWWVHIEQQSLELSLEYDYVLQTDITDCYGSIYTHSIPWALHTKAKAKENRNGKNLLGNNIDKLLQDMSYGQTNGIPQGSVLMDFIAEMVLGNIDLLLSQNIKHIEDYKILRYRDDYRIFANSPNNIDEITKILSETLVEMGMKLNPNKTAYFDDVITSSIKPDKLFWNKRSQWNRNFQKHLLIIHDLAKKHPNSGSLSSALEKYFKSIIKVNDIKNPKPLISIVVEIMLKNPRTYPIGTAILSKLIASLDNKDDVNFILSSIMRKFKQIPNNSHLQVWLQRLTLKTHRFKDYNEKLCKKVFPCSIMIWNSKWLDSKLEFTIDFTNFIDHNVLSKMTEIMSKAEIELFWDNYGK